MKTIMRYSVILLVIAQLIYAQSVRDLYGLSYDEKIQIVDDLSAKRLKAQKLDADDERSLLVLLYDPSEAPPSTTDVVFYPVWRRSLNDIRAHYPDINGKIDFSLFVFDEDVRSEFVRQWIASGRELPPEVRSAYEQREAELAQERRNKETDQERNGERTTSQISSFPPTEKESEAGANHTVNEPSTNQNLTGPNISKATKPQARSDQAKSSAQQQNDHLWLWIGLGVGAAIIALVCWRFVIRKNS